MGGPRRSPGETVDALEEAIQIIRLFWSGEQAIDYEGRFYSVRGMHPGPPPAHPIGIWLGAYKPRMLALTGRLADGWVPSLPYAPPPEIPGLGERIDEAAAAGGRNPSEIRRIYNVVGEITDDGESGDGLRGTAAQWSEWLTSFAVELGFDALIFWPRGDTVRQVERFAMEVAPAVREAVVQPG
jgi:alkanesulfonate monooxygenase SsuD/methylene tetrahydromethanopterin reductase-like flavin-dependent oxidoreductase (luciferase family)